MPYPYATVSAVKLRLGQPNNSSLDPLLAAMCEQVNAYIESVTGRALGSSTVTNELLDGWEAVEGGYCLMYPKGIRSISSLEVATYTGAPYQAIPSTDYFIRPVAALRSPGWPAFEIWMTDIPSASNPLPTFQPGFATIRHTSEVGWSQMPPEVREVGEVAVVRAWKARQAGQTDEVGNDETGVQTISRFISGRDRETLMRYRQRVIEII